MKTLLGLIASPRKHGNCELFVKELFRQLPAGEWQLSLARLPALDIRPCKACYRCLFDDMTCPQKDDFNPTLEALTAADAVAVAAPTYFLGANSSLKRFLDRGLAFYGKLDRLWAKPAVGVAIAGIQGMEGYTKLSVDSFLKLSLADHRGSEVLYGALPGEIFLTDAAQQTARRLAAALTAGSKASATKPDSDPDSDTDTDPDSAPRCPLCGGDTFRFLGGNRLRCMLCSSEGSLEFQEERINIATNQGEHPLFLSLQDVKKHMEWLRGMKQVYRERRNELKAIIDQHVTTRSIPLVELGCSVENS